MEFELGWTKKIVVVSASLHNFWDDYNRNSLEDFDEENENICGEQLEMWLKWVLLGNINQYKRKEENDNVKRFNL